MNWYVILWLVGLVLFLTAEAATVAVVSLWFAGGSLVALLAAALGAPFWLQILLFLLVSVALLLSLRPLLRKYIDPKLTRTNVDAVISSQGIVLEDIDNLQNRGKVKLGGMEWSARSTTGEKISAGTVIVVDKVEGVKVFVTALPVESKV